MKAKLTFVVLLFLLAFGFFLRFWRLGEIPPGLSRDEASHGYTSLSVLKTAKDEYGNFLPLSIKAFGDWRLPAYDYLSVPFLITMGTSDLSVRFLSAIAGVITLLAVFLLAKELSTNSLLALTILATLPWHLHFSRYAHEANLALMWLVLALLLFLKGLKKPLLFLFSGLFFALTLFSYYAYFVFAPIFIFTLGLIYRSTLKKFPRTIIGAFAIFILFTGIIMRSVFGGAQVKSSISFFTDPVIIHSQIELPRSKTGNSLIGKMVYNRPVIFTKMFLERYIKTFSPQFLAIKGGEHPLHNVPGVGNLFIFQYPLFMAGVIFLLKKHNQKSLLILSWLIMAPLASSLTKDAPNSGRVSMMIPPLVLTITIGLTGLFSILKSNFGKTFLCCSLVIIVALSLKSFFRNYFLELPLLRASFWGAGYQELVTYLNLPENINKTVITQRPNYSPYIYYLFYSQYDPQKYQNEAQRYPPTTDGFYHVKSFSRYQFRDFNFEKEFKQDQLMVVWPETLKKDQKERWDYLLKKEIIWQGQTLFFVFENKATKTPESLR